MDQTRSKIILNEFKEATGDNDGISRRSFRRRLTWRIFPTFFSNNRLITDFFVSFVFKFWLNIFSAMEFTQLSCRQRIPLISNFLLLSANFLTSILQRGPKVVKLEACLKHAQNNRWSRDRYNDYVSGCIWQQWQATITVNGRLSRPPVIQPPTK